MYSVQCIVYSVQSTSYSVKCTIYTKNCILYTGVPVGDAGFEDVAVDVDGVLERQGGLQDVQTQLGGTEPRVHPEEGEEEIILKMDRNPS